MASGKSTVGRELSRKLNRAFIDLDTQIETHLCKSIPDIFQSEGESGFRNYELQELERVTSQNRSMVMATGGGIITQEVARNILHAKWFTIYLQVNPDTVANRVIQDGPTRPLLKDTESLLEKVTHLLKIRGPWYAEVARYTCQVDEKTPLQITEEIISALKNEFKMI